MAREPDLTTLHGRIEEGTVANLLQYLSLGAASGCLTLRHPERLQGNVYLQEGKVVFIEARPLYDVAALASLLVWRSGRFSFRAGVATPRHTLDRSVERVLLEASHHADSQARGRGSGMLGEDTVLNAASGRRTDVSGSRGNAHGPDEEVLLSLAALHLWRRIDGVSSLRELAAFTRRPVSELVAAAQELVAHGLADFASLLVADPRFARELSREAVDLLGPVGAIVVEDALYDLGYAAESLPVGAVDELLVELGRAFPNGAMRDEFLRRAIELRRLFALDAAARGSQL